MQRRTITILIGVIGTLVLLFCGAIGAGGYYLTRQFAYQREQMAALSATLNAELNASPSSSLPAPAAATPAEAATAPALPSPDPVATTAAPPSTALPAPGNLPQVSLDSPLLAANAPPPDVRAALAPELRAALDRHPNATLYRIDARLDPDSQTVDGAQTVRLTNDEGVALDALYFRLYVNAEHYQEGGIAVEELRLDGQPASFQLELADTALKIDLPQPLAPGQSIEIGLRFTVTVPSSGGGYGIFNFADGVFTLYNWHPELAVYEDGAWLLNPVSNQGDPTNTDTSNYLVRFTAPEGYQVITSGIESAPTPQNGQIAHESVSALARNFVVVASDRFQQAAQQVGTTTVTSYYQASDEQGGKDALAAAAGAIELFGAEFGPYAYPELDVVEVKLGGGAAGMESTGLIMIGSDFYAAEQGNPLGGLGGVVEGADKLSLLGFITAHEVAHQWWYSVVGSDAYTQPWLDEGLTNWSSAFYVDRIAGDQAGLLARDMLISLPYRAVLASGDQRLDQPVDTFDAQEYSAIVYGKGALMYDVLRRELGDEKFFEFLRRYYQQHQFARVDGADWRATLAEVAGPDVADTFYTKWVESSDISPADLPPGGPMSDLIGNLGQLDSLLATPEE